MREDDLHYGAELLECPIWELSQKDTRCIRSGIVMRC